MRDVVQHCQPIDGLTVIFGEAGANPCASIVVDQCDLIYTKMPLVLHLVPLQ